MKSFFKSFPESSMVGSVKDQTWHGSGHAETNATGSTTGFIFMSFIFLALACGYLMYRVYCKNKMFSGDWIKEFGEQSENVVGFGADKQRPDGKDERTGKYKEAPNTSAM